MGKYFNIDDFEKYRKDNCREVKSACGGLPQSLWETYSSFANTYGGVIILGVTESDDGTWKTTGLKDVNRLKKEFWDIINNRKKVSCNILSEDDVECYSVDGDLILVITVPMANREQKPVYLKNDMFQGTFKRTHEGDYRCTPEQIKAMLRDQTERTADMTVLEELQVDDLCLDTIHSYRNRYNIVRSGHPWTNLSDIRFLQKIGAVAPGKDRVCHPTGAGLLMFGEEHTILRVFPAYFLDFREVQDSSIRWVDRLVSSSGEWSGNLFDFYFRVYTKLIKNVKTPFKLIDGIRIDDTPVHKAIREALANCLINADYYLPRGIVICQNAEMITFANPGSIRVGKRQMCAGGESDPRNKVLMKMFTLIDIGERAGSGVPEIFATWEHEGWEKPQIDERIGDVERTCVTLKFKTSDNGEVASDKPALTSDNGEDASDKPALTSDNGEVASDKPALTSDNGEIASDKPALTSDNGEDASDNPAPTSDNEEVASDKPALASDNGEDASDKPALTSDKILAYLKNHPLAKTKDIAAAIGLSPARTRSLLVNMDAVVPHGANRNRTYSLRK